MLVAVWVEWLEAEVGLTEGHFLALVVQQVLVEAEAGEEEEVEVAVEAVAVEEGAEAEVEVEVAVVALVEVQVVVVGVEVVVPQNPCYNDNHICKAGLVGMALAAEHSQPFFSQPWQKPFSYPLWDLSMVGLQQSYQP